LDESTFETALGDVELADKVFVASGGSDWELENHNEIKPDRSVRPVKFDLNRDHHL